MRRRQESSFRKVQEDIGAFTRCIGVYPPSDIDEFLPGRMVFVKTRSDGYLHLRPIGISLGRIGREVKTENPPNRGVRLGGRSENLASARAVLGNMVARFKSTSNFSVTLVEQEVIISQMPYSDIVNAIDFNFLNSFLLRSDARNHLHASYSNSVFGVITSVRKAKACIRSGSEMVLELRGQATVPDGNVGADVQRNADSILMDDLVGVVGVHMVCFEVNVQEDSYRVSTCFRAQDGGESRFRQSIRRPKAWRRVTRRSRDIKTVAHTVPRTQTPRTERLE